MFPPASVQKVLENNIKTLEKGNFWKNSGLEYAMVSVFRGSKTEQF